MLNFLEMVRSDPGYPKLAIGNFLFTEYTCSVSDKELKNWTNTDFLVHILKGKKTWHTADGVWTGRPGETLFFKKGATILEQHFEGSVCMLIFFIPDAQVRQTVRELAGTLGTTGAGVTPMGSACRVEADTALFAFFQSMRTYVAGKEMPSEALLRLKVRELVVILLGSERNATLAAYVRRIGESDSPSVSEIMEANFRFNLSLEEYARLCHRSLSSFKRDFRRHYVESPGRWLLRKRLDYASQLLGASNVNVTEAALESGFEDVSHFSRAFKKQFGASPMAFRNRT